MQKQNNSNNKAETISPVVAWPLFVFIISFFLFIFILSGVTAWEQKKEGKDMQYQKELKEIVCFIDNEPY